MPKYCHYTFEDGGVAIWHITESVDELYALLATDKYDMQLSEKHHIARRAEWLAVRLLVKEFVGEDCEVAYHATGRPYLKGSDVYISISHTKGFAVLAYHYKKRIGVDIEYFSSRVERVVDRFTSLGELSYIEGHDDSCRQMYYLINWSAKEALYKLFDSPAKADFKTAFQIAPYSLSKRGSLCAVVNDVEEDNVMVCYRVFPQFVCTWVEWNV